MDRCAAKESAREPRPICASGRQRDYTAVGQTTSLAGARAMTHVIFVTHPDVVVDPEVPVPEWRLSPRGLQRIRTMLAQPWVRSVAAVFASAEHKARDAAAI